MFLTNIANNSTGRKINILCLAVTILIVLVLPLKKEMWYDETISMFCSKGIGHDLSYFLDSTNTTNSDKLAEYNTAANVFHATVKDNANSYIYNIGLHWFTALSGNSLQAYMLFSKLTSIATLIALFVLCGMFWGNSLFTSVAMLLLVTDTDFIGMSHEIRAYSMGMCFVTIAAIYFFKFIEKDKPLYLFLLGLFSVAAILSHFLSVYIILSFLIALIYLKRGALFSGRNIAAMIIPVALLGLFFLLAYPGLQVMNKQSQEIHAKTVSGGFSIWEMLHKSARFFALNFKVVFPAFINKSAVVIISAVSVIILYVAGQRNSGNNNDKRNLSLLFLPGVSGSIFLAFLSIKAQHYTPLYYRYYSFCLPFCCLFTAYALQLIYSNPKINMLIKSSIISVILLPSMALFIIGIRNNKPDKQYNHIEVAKKITTGSVNKIEVQLWTDAFLIQCVLPVDYKIDYVRNKIAPYFTLYNAKGIQQIPVLRIKE